MMDVLYKGQDKTVPITIVDNSGPVPVEDVTVGVELYIKDRLVGSFSKVAGTVKATATANVCEIYLSSAETARYPVGQMVAVITVGFTDPEYQDGIRHERVKVDGYLVKEAR